MFFNTDDLNDGEVYLKLNRTAEENIEKGYVPAYHFEITRVIDNVGLGWCDLRVGHNDNTYYGGNIGYEVYEDYRGHHYAGKACILLFNLAKKHNLETVIITCSPENTASRKTCEFAGGILEKIVDVPEWHDMYKDGRRRTCRYVIDVANIGSL